MRLLSDNDIGRTYQILDITKPSGQGLLVGFFVFLILYFFRSFNIDLGASCSGHSHFSRSLFFGLFNAVLFGLPVKERYITFTLPFRVFLGLIGTFSLFNYFWCHQDWAWSVFGGFTLEYLLMLSLPLSAITWKIRKGKSELAEWLILRAENGKEELRIRKDSLAFVKSEGNYIMVNYQIQDQELKSKLIRRSLKSLEEAPETGAFLKRSHKQYLVNPLWVQSHEKVSGGRLNLVLRGNIMIPLSANYQKHWQ